MSIISNNTNRYTSDIINRYIQREIKSLIHAWQRTKATKPRLHWCEIWDFKTSEIKWIFDENVYHVANVLLKCFYSNRVGFYDFRWPPTFKATLFFYQPNHILSLQSMCDQRKNMENSMDNRFSIPPSWRETAFINKFHFVGFIQFPLLIAFRFSAHYGWNIKRKRAKWKQFGIFPMFFLSLFSICKFFYCKNWSYSSVYKLYNVQCTWIYSSNWIPFEIIEFYKISSNWKKNFSLQTCSRANNSRSEFVFDMFDSKWLKIPFIYAWECINLANGWDFFE